MIISGFSSFLERLLSRTGKCYPILVLLLMQIVNTPIVILLTALPARHNAELSNTQGSGLLVFGSILLSIRNTVLLAYFYYSNQDMFACLFKKEQAGSIKIDEEQEERAWKQLNSISKRYVLFEFLAFHIFIVIPVVIFGYFTLQLSRVQIIYFILAALPASLVNLIMESLAIDQWLEPVFHTLIPKKYEIQLLGLNGTRLWVKLSTAIIGLVFISLLLVVPTAFHHVDLIISDDVHSFQLANDALKMIVTAGTGAVLAALILSYRLVSYFSMPFRKMIDLFREIEKGDLKQRIKVSSADEFGELNIHINHTIERLQCLTISLEQQVAERTLLLSQTNERLLVELTERKRMEDELAYCALHDPLTNLPNRSLFMDRLSHALERSKRHQDFSYAVIFIDLDRFKAVNDSHGHNVGDLLLIESAHRLQACVRSEDTVARFGGDEFVILLESPEDNLDYIGVAERIQSELAMPAHLADYQAFISISMGVVFSDSRYECPEDILRDADIAMYHAKKHGKGRFKIFDAAMFDNVTTRIELETDLKNALEKQELVLHYQPILSLSSLRIIGFEALVHWLHPKRGLIPPSEFLLIAEETGLIIPIGDWALDEACRQTRVWQELYPVDPPLAINVNLSTRQCNEHKLSQKIENTLHKYNLNTESLSVGLAENLIAEDSETISVFLSNLRDLGVKVQMDDFGTGYSSLAYLHTLPIDILEIDHTFIDRLGSNGKGLAIVKSILLTAHNLGMEVIAEGVETDEQLSKLKSLGCEYVQGNLVAGPLDSHEACMLLCESFFEIFDECKCSHHCG